MNQCQECQGQTPNPKFCSLSCSAVNQMRKQKANIKPHLKVCKKCGSEFNYGRDYKKQFCNSSCSAKFNNSLRSSKVCDYCGNSFKGAGKKYCSIKCSSQGRTNDMLVAWTKDSNSATTKQGLSRSIISHLIEKYNHQCSQCGWGEVNPVTNKSPLEVDHIDGNCYNNDESNLRVLCPNCHALTSTYKALNKQGQRKYR